MTCRLCKDNNSIEDEDHVFIQCERLVDKDSTQNLNINHIYGTLRQQIEIMRHISAVSLKRKLLLEAERRED